MMILLWRQPENLEYDLIVGTFWLALFFAWIWWDRQLGKRWRQARTKSWLKIQGKLNDGEIIPMLKGRSKDIAGYEVWFDYEYASNGEQHGLYKTAEFKTEEQAAQVLAALEGKEILVRVHPRRPDKSIVCEQDITGLADLLNGD